MRLALIAIFGAAGALARVGITQLAANTLQVSTFLATLSINLTGSFLIGLFCSAGASHLKLNEELLFALVTGFLGGFTTFSAFSYDCVDLFNEGRQGVAFLYLLSSVAGGIACAALGFFVGSLTKVS